MRIEVDPMDVVVTAQRVRDACGQTEPAFSTRQMVAMCFPDAVVTGRALPDGIEEMVTVTPDGPLIVYSRSLTPPLQRFVIAHAMAHLLFDDSRVSYRGSNLGDPVAEARADAFAEELLVPLAELDQYVSVPPDSNDDVYRDQVDEIASHFNVSTDLIDKRIRDLVTSAIRAA